MNNKIVTGVSLALLLVCSLGKADFKYTQSSKLTGGMMAGMMKVMGAFSKQARGPMVSTTYFKGNRMRRESADGNVEIIDLGSKQIINIDARHHSYSVMTFEQMRQALEQMQQRMQQAQHQQQGAQNVQMQMKIHVTPTNQTQQILGQTAQEMKVDVDLEAQGQDPNNPSAGTQSGAMRMAIDSWVAPNISGYQEVRQFYMQMAKEIGWTPNTTPMMDPRMSKAMVDLAKSGKLPSGLPLLETVNFGLAGLPASANGAQAQGNSGSQNQASQSSDQSSSAQGAVAKSILGRFGGFGHKKHQDSDDTNNQNSAPPQDAASAQGNASLMEMTIQVTSFSTDALDGSLFEVPAGLKQRQPNLNRPL